MRHLSSVTTEILMENAVGLNERREIMDIVDEAATGIDSALISKVYDNALKKSHVDFGSIPESKGDITKYAGYSQMLEVIKTLRVLSTQTKVKIPELDTLEESINCIKALKPHFEAGFRLGKEFTIITYNTMVYACVESLSAIISAYVNVLKFADKEQLTIDRNPKKGKWLCLENLEKFNRSAKTGEITKVLKVVNGDSQQSNFLGTATIPIVAIAGSVAMVTILRELIYYFYNTRREVSEYLEHQAKLLEINKTTIELSSKFTESEKKDIIEKQQKAIDKMLKMSDKIKVVATSAEKDTMVMVKADNKELTLKNLESDAMQTSNSQMYGLL